ncbi:glycosyl hydrolase family 18 protein [Leadbetterella sp. DM7]|uniref:glycosyl hydrolase family 18 protein n=1 Tax=Leadbetterella sp. DM7 TaxID=3235085 RepID=UPI00349EEE41
MKTLLTVLLFISACCQAQDFRIIGYYMPSKDPIPLQYYTHINYSFAIPAKTGDTLLPLRNPEHAREVISRVHAHNKQIFLSIGGWGIGDAGGDDTRFHKMAETAQGRRAFLESTLKMVSEFGFDGVDLDWEYPDEDSPSADQYVLLVNDLADALHKQNKQLTAAVISYGKKGYGIKKEAFDKMDWLNLMAYDDDYGPDYVRAHSPYSLALKSLDYWLNERGLPAHKAVLGLPYYSKRGMGNYGPSYKDLLKDGASPYDDYWKGAFYNGIPTIRLKTRLALERGLGGVMIWEVRNDSNDEFSLGKAIYETVQQR